MQCRRLTVFPALAAQIREGANVFGNNFLFSVKRRAYTRPYKGMKVFDNFNQLKKWKIGKAEKWLVDHAKFVGIDIDGLNHIITKDFKAHVNKRHGDPEKEEPQGQISVEENDYEYLPEVVKSPDRVILGAKNRQGLNVLNYAKKIGKGTVFYAEELLKSKKNNELRGKTMIIRKKDADDKLFKHFASNNGKNDLSQIKIIGPVSAGGYPSFYTD